MHPLLCFQAPGKRSVAGSPVSKRSWFWNPFWFFVALLVGITGIVLLMSRPFLERDGEGNWKIAEWREEKLKRELEGIDLGEQYVLVAGDDQWYDCFNCPNSTRIYLYKGEVWKYGVTRKGEKARYGNWLKRQKLRYMIEYEGYIGECLRREKIQIYGYPLLPENLNRNFPIIRPPGNKIDQ